MILRPVLILGLLLILPSASAQNPTASIAPARFDWTDYSTSFAHFEVSVTNPSAAREAYTITEIKVDPEPRGLAGELAPTAKIYSPTPTLVLEPQATGTFHVWIGGLDQPSPPGPPAGDYGVTVKILSTLDPNRQTTATASIRRSFPVDGEPAIIDGRVTDSATGTAPTPQGGSVVVHAANASSARVLPSQQDTVTADTEGGFRLSVPPGRYWLRLEAAGYRAAYFGPLDLGAGESRVEVAMTKDAPPPIVATQARVGDAGLPTYRLATTVGLERAATTPGFYSTQAGSAAEKLSFFAGSASRLWQKDLPPHHAPPFDYAAWTSTDYGLDVNADGTLVAVGTPGGTIEVYDAEGDLRWSHRDEPTRNSRVPGPLGEGIRRSSEVRFSDDGEFLAAGTLTGLVYHFNVTTGARQWRFETEGQVRALRYDQNATTLFVGSGDNNLYAIDAKTGVEKWQAPLTFWPWEHIALADGTRRIAVGGKDGILRVFDGDGQPSWTHAFPGFILGYDFDASGSNLVVLAEHGVYAFDATGRLRWFRHEIQNSGQVRVGSVGEFFGYGKASTNPNEATARVLSLNGTLVWEFRAGAQPETIYNVQLLEDGTRLIANGRQGKLYSFANWRSASTSAPDESPTTPGTDDTARDEPGLGALAAIAAVLGAMVLRRRGPPRMP